MTRKVMLWCPPSPLTLTAKQVLILLLLCQLLSLAFPFHVSPPRLIGWLRRTSSQRFNTRPMAATAAETNGKTDLICLEQLLSTCIDATIQGCNVIRKYKKENNTVTGELKEAGEIKSVVTQADIDAQRVIVDGLRQVWTDKLNIVGEEDENESSTTVSGSQQSLLRTNLLDGIIPSQTMVPRDELTLFVDPLDGTREFVEGRVQNVGCLIGVARRGRSIVGAIGLPFPEGLSSPAAKTLYAIHLDDDIADMSHHGCFPATEQRPKNDKESPKGITVFTGDSKDPVLKNATALALNIAASPDKAEPPIHTLLGGTTSKFVAVAQQEQSISVLHFKTCYWDTCATEAVLNAMGGKVTDFFGSPLTHLDDKRYSYGNKWGVVASSKGMEQVHDAICAGMRADFKSVQRTLEPCFGTIPKAAEGPQAVDIGRDLDGYPLTRTWLEEHILEHQEEDNKDWSLKGFGIPEKDAVRGLMSNGARLVLDWTPAGNTSSDKSPPPPTVFYKRVVMSDLAHARAKLATVPHKVTRDVHSYQVETNFLSSKAQECLIHEAGVHVCDNYGANRFIPPNADDGPRQQLESRFSMTLEDFNVNEGWYQEWLLEPKTCLAVLEALARMHAFFWEGSNFWRKDGGKVGAELEQTVWPNGGYVQPALQGYAQLKKVESGWTHRLPTFKDDLSGIPELEGVDLEQIGVRLERLASFVGTRAHPFAEAAKKDTADLQKYRTLIHGDPKQANLFFRPSGDDNQLQVGLIDFQWSGFGLAATDVAHFICAALQPHCLSRDGQKESELLDYYHAALSRALVKHGVASSIEEVGSSVFPRQVLQDQYEVAFLDICRIVFAYAWQRWKPETKPTAASLGRNSYNKSLPSVLWLITRCSSILASKEKIW